MVRINHKGLVPIMMLAALCALFLSSCNREKTYVINGSFDIPQELALGDTLFDRGSLEGSFVYMVDLNMDIIDSVLVENETFKFEGKIMPKESFFAYIVTDYAYGLIAVEPGEINIIVDSSDVRAYGTDSNDEIEATHDKIVVLADEFDNDFYSLVENAGPNPNPEDSLRAIMIYNSFQLKVLALLDSVYQANPENLVGVWAAETMLSSAQSLEEFDEMLDDYSDYVKEAPYVISRRNYFRAIEAQRSYLEMMEDEDQ